ncbi:hypothetical protein QYE76_058949 [Lolium multiflorum]|uniref:CCHC-type domain-containing protein n=1 Tax=Lolium multiflorum TaxID=4521 RepID=A0AAD8T7E3_LOLMU|nr:hypothetical protein QYE76_058949 [Lolium multiflorum]
MMLPCRTPHGHLAPYKYTVPRASISTPNLLLSILSISSHPLHVELATTVAQLHAGDPQAAADPPPIGALPGDATAARRTAVFDNDPCTVADPRRRPSSPSTVLPAPPRVDDDDEPPPHDLPLILRSAPSRTDSDASTGDHQEEEDFYNKKGEENLDPHFTQGKPIPMQYGFPLNKRHRGYAESCLYHTKKRYEMMRNEVNVRPKPCAVPRLTDCLHWEAKLMGRGAYTRMTYQWESYQLGPEGDLKFEKELKQLVDYLGHPYPKFFGIPLKAKSGEPPQWDVSTDLRRRLDAPMAPPTSNNSRAQANQIQTEHAKMTDAINILAMECKALRHQHATKDYLIARLRVKIASLERLIPIPHHAPRRKSNATCYDCGVTGHYSNKCPVRAANNAPRTGSNAVPITQNNKSMVTCYECGTMGHYSNECPKKLAKIAANPAASTQQQRRFATRKKFAPNYPNNRNGRYYNMKATEAPEAPQNMPNCYA